MTGPAGTTTYGIQVFQYDRTADLNKLRQGVATELIELGLHRTVSVAVAESRPPDTSPCVGVYLGSPAAAADLALTGRVSSELRKGMVMIPVVRSLRSFSSLVPAALSMVNGVAWRTEQDLKQLVRALLRELGIEENQRRVFISHKRDDGLGAAEQLHDKLSHAGFRPFIDRFSIGAGEEVQEKIADALEDHAFLLLLETPLAHTSDWVFDEVEYALSHTMGLSILKWPGPIPPVPGSGGIARLELLPTDLVADAHGFDTLTAPALDRVVAHVESAHASGLTRRRRMLVGSIEESARAGGARECVALRDWRVLVSKGKKSTIVATTPRLPTARDLQYLDQAAGAVPGDHARLLVHSARILRPELRAHLKWVAEGRRIATIPENAVGAWW